MATQGERLEAHDLDELDALARSAGLQPVLREVLRRNRPDPALYLGSGAAERIADQLRTERIGLVLFDHAISAIQQRNLERLWKVQVADRTELIIEIFSQRARSTEGKLKGIEAVIDKDLTASVLAEALEADALLILTDVDGVYEDFGTENQKQVPRATPAALRAMGLPSGSMGPKVEAVCRFVELTGDMAAIGRLEDAVSIIEGQSGTIVTPGGNYGGPDDIHPPIPEQIDTRIRRA